MIRRLKNISIDSVGANSLWIILQMQCNCKSMYQFLDNMGKLEEEGVMEIIMNFEVWMCENQENLGKEKGHEGGLTLPDIKIYLKAVVIKE